MVGRIGEEMGKVKTVKKIGTIGPWTEEVSPTALNKCRLEIPTRKMRGGVVEMVEEIFLLEMGMIHLVVDQLLVEDVVEDRTELEDPRQI
jgi:hypothetical protein